MTKTKQKGFLQKHRQIFGDSQPIRQAKRRLALAKREEAMGLIEQIERHRTI